MNKFVLGLLLSLFSLNSFAQGDNAAKIIPNDQVEEPPYHKDCEALKDSTCSIKWISNYLNQEFDHKLFGPEEVFINFAMKIIIDKNGKVAWTKPMSDSKAVNHEVAKLMKNLPAMEPGKHKGENVAVTYLIPITLKYLYYFPDTYSLNDVDVPPLINGCKEAKDMKYCFSGKINAVIHENSRTMSLPKGSYSGMVSILINEDGEISAYSVKANSENFKKGLEKIRKNLPKFESGAILNGEKVKITINFPVTATIF